MGALTACEEYRPADAAVKPAADTALGSKVQTANSRARAVYTAAGDYCTECLVEGAKVNPGWYRINAGSTASSYKKDGTDLENAVRSKVSSTDETSQFAAVKIGEDGSAQYVFWAAENVFASLNNADLDSMATGRSGELYCASSPIVGGYPTEFKAGDVNTVDLESRGKQ